MNGLSLTIGEGEIVCLIGESGSGKSVIAHSIMGLLPNALSVSSGTIRVLGDDVAAMSPETLRTLRGNRMSMIFQEPMTALNPVERCGAQIEELLLIHGERRAGTRRATTLEMLRQVHFADPERIYRSYPHQLSGGQRQRVMIALALCLKPALLICDEPTTALDVTTQAEILALILELRQLHGTAILFITHDIGVARQIADRIAVMRLGDAVEEGPCAAVLDTPATAYTRQLIAAVPALQPMRVQDRPAQAPILEVTDLSNAHRQTAGLFAAAKETVVARNINLVIRPGETLGVVGESGSGKSSLARCIAGLDSFDGGEIRIGGSSVSQRRRRSEDKAFRRQVQMVFQDPYRSLNPRRRVLDSMIEGPMNLGWSREAAVEKACALMDRVRLSRSVLGRYPHEFSGGQRQRICIARALACEPKLLIADEAVSALDVSVQKEILDLLEEVQAQFQLAMLFITHDLRVAARLCDRILVMQAGQVIEEGTARQVLAAPAAPYTRRLIAAIPGHPDRRPQP
ncbi:ABC transporter ATP-binding protein [Stenotrophomonas sp. CPCC 101365]|uniref:ABC-type dipeptide transporter n=1 Tax=Stenotrophomonas mori TaxID=2871096 RepID=A0ABT0SHN3_9GAMM|nr:ABC transporter ATP-binding protein [Stenotrophomonas mori]